MAKGTVIPCEYPYIHAPSGPRGGCATCAVERKKEDSRVRYLTAGRGIYQSRKEEMRADYFLATYGLSMGAWEELLNTQGWLCALCGRDLSTCTRRGIHVDHDHATGAIRGVLCTGCNTGLGALGDNVEGLRRALAYLEG